MTANTENNVNLASLISRGGVYHNISGKTPKDVLINLIKKLPVFHNLDNIILLQATLEREELMSTGIGRGVAVPHPRNPVLEENGLPFIALGFLSEATDWNTYDGSMVSIIFLVVSVSAKQHLAALSEINFLCQHENFLKQIKTHSSKDEVISAILEAEKNW